MNDPHAPHTDDRIAVLGTSGLGPQGSDPLLLALTRYVEALDRRYPEGPDQMRQEALAARANITRMPDAWTGRVA